MIEGCLMTATKFGNKAEDWEAARVRLARSGAKHEQQTARRG